MAKSKISADRLRELLHYDPSTGIFVWRVNHGVSVKAGMQAGYLSDYGYIRIRVDGFRSSAHRLAWLYVYGRHPNGEIDHINRVRDDNRLCNLREVTRSQNQQNTLLQSNNTSGFKGVSWSKKVNRWQAHIYIKGSHKYLGYYDSAEDANAAYVKAASEIHTHNPAAQGGSDAK